LNSCSGPDGQPTTFKLQLTNPRVNVEYAFDAIDNIDRVNGCIMLYDITDRDSFDQFVLWWKASAKRDTIPTVLMGNHCDEADNGREIPLRKVTTWGKKENIPVFEVSAKTGTHFLIFFSFVS
jgi:GTPase SAR1 family protein